MELPATEEFFNKHSSGKYGLQPRCKDCKYEENKRIRLANPEKANEMSRIYRDPEKTRKSALSRSRTPKYKRKFWEETLKKYGLTSESYQEILSAQSGGCAICGKTEEQEGTHLHVDHDHQDNTRRGLLCGNCNRALGLFLDRPELLQKAIKYLTQWKNAPNKVALRESKPIEHISVESAKQLRSIGLTHAKIAKILGCSQAGVSVVLKGWPETSAEANLSVMD